MQFRLLNDRKIRAKRNIFLLAPLLALALLVAAVPVRAATTPDPALLASTYSHEETLTYEISWLGLTAGRLVIHLVPETAATDRYAIRVTARTAGMLDVFYPVEDHFETVVEGGSRLPSRYKVDQHEGSRRKQKLTLYDQHGGVITYRRNDEPAIVYTVAGPTYNEFSAFMIMRALPMTVGNEVVVPTFADEKRHEVKVAVEKEETVASLIGKVACLRVRPHLNFKGLYTKMGDPLVWLSNDRERLPLLIKAKIAIGSLTARLVERRRGPKGRAAELTAPAPQPPADTDSGEEWSQ